MTTDRWAELAEEAIVECQRVPTWSHERDQLACSHHIAAAIEKAVAEAKDDFQMEHGEELDRLRKERDQYKAISAQSNEYFLTLVKERDDARAELLAAMRAAQEEAERKVRSRKAIWEGHGGNTKLASPYSHLTVEGELRVVEGAIDAIDLNAVLAKMREEKS